MFLSRRISMLLLSISCCFASLQGDFITLSVWERTLPSGEKQQLICLGDQHDLTAQADEQANDLVKFLRERNCESDCILVEDMVDFEHVLHYVKQYLKQHMVGFTESVLTNVQRRYLDEVRPFFWSPSKQEPAVFKIGPYAERHGIRVINVEHRQLFGFPFSASWRKLVNEINSFVLSRVLEELEKYDDNGVLNQFYEDIIGRYADIKEMLKRKATFVEILSGTPWDRLIGKEHSLYKEFRDTLSLRLQYPILFFAEVLDAMFLHNIYQLQIQQEQSNLLVVGAGCVHTVNIERVLPKLGYECIGNKGGPFSFSSMDSMMPISIKSSLDSIFSNTSTSTPQNNKLQAKL